MTILPPSNLPRNLAFAVAVGSRHQSQNPGPTDSHDHITCILVVLSFFLSFPLFLGNLNSFSIPINPTPSLLYIYSIAIPLPHTPPIHSLLLNMAAPQPSHSSSSSSAASSGFNDYLPLMASKLGGDGLIGELCNGFNLLMDSDKGVITFDSLKKNSAMLGLQDLTDDDLKAMMKEGDFDGDGSLNQMEFCVLMFRLSPELMEASQFLLEEAFDQEFKDFH